MISRNIKNIVDIQRNGKRVLNVIKNGKVVYYYIPDSYVELEYIKCFRVNDGEDSYTGPTVNIPFTSPDSVDNKLAFDLSFKINSFTNNFRYESLVNLVSSYSTADSDINQFFSSYSGLGEEGFIRYGRSNSVKKSSIPLKTKIDITTHFDDDSNLVIESNLNGINFGTQSSYGYGNGTLRINSVNGKDRFVEDNDIHSIYLKNQVGRLILFLVPVRRLGDAICGMYDTINQKFYPSETQVQFKGGPVKTVKNEFLTGNSWEKVTNMQWSKNSSYSRYKKTFITDMVNKPYANTSHTKVLRTATSGVDEINGYGAAMTPPTYIDFQRLLFTNNNTGNILLQNINPNWNIIKTINAETNSFETNNQNLYFANKDSIEVVPTGNKKGNTNNVSVAKSSINRIVHLPYLEFTGEETSVINIGFIEITKDTRFKIRYEKHPVRSFDPIFGYGTNETHACYLLPDSKNDANTESRIFFKNGDVEGSWYNTANTNYPSGTIDIQNNTVEFDGVRVNDARHGTDNQPDTWSDFALGAGFDASLTNIYYWIGTINYFRLECKNSLYRHYLPSIMILNDGTYYLGFFESVEQIFYQCDSKTKPAYSGSSLNDDWSNIIDINGNTEVYSKVIDIIHTGNWRDNQVWNDSKIWSDTGSITK